MDTTTPSHRTRWLAVGALLLASCLPLRRAGEPAPPPADPPPVEREFRGVWVATVANIDWPSEPGLPPDRQREELLAILDRAAELNLNAVIFQVRPAADALYSSPHEPWSEYLTGEMGRAPRPFYDPLAFAVREAHRRGLELHAWFNPFRARHSSAAAPPAPDHISRTHPDRVRTYGDQLWMDPGDERVRAHSLRVIRDVVRRYDIDGVHIDDYFYPYPVRDSSGARIDFPDEPTWRRHAASGDTITRDDWRRRNVDRFIENLYRAIKEEKPRVKFGISPFGIWRPRHPAQIRGFDAYAEIYADARKWLRSGWIDYFTPQLYWAIEPEAQSFPALLRWWVDENEDAHRRHLWPGIIPNKVGSGDSGWPAGEITAQIRRTRLQPGATGNIHFSARTLLRDTDSLSTRLASRTYRDPALVPASPWLDSEPPRPPLARLRDRRTLRLTPHDADDVFLWVVQARYEDGWSTRILPGDRRRVRVSREGRPPTVVFASAVDRAGNRSVPVRAGTGDPAVTPDP